MTINKKSQSLFQLAVKKSIIAILQLWYILTSKTLVQFYVIFRPVVEIQPI